MSAWQVQDAKTHLSEVMAKAESEGPQTITRHGIVRAVVLSVKEYQALVAHKPDLKSYLLGGPKIDAIPLDRVDDRGRDVPL